jgi:hypothetical protein
MTKETQITSVVAAILFLVGLSTLMESNFFSYMNAPVQERKY